MSSGMLRRDISCRFIIIIIIIKVPEVNSVVFEHTGISLHHSVVLRYVNGTAYMPKTTARSVHPFRQNSD